MASTAPRTSRLGGLPELHHAEMDLVATRPARCQPLARTTAPDPWLRPGLSVDDLAREQDDVVSRAQLLRAGVSRHAVRSQVQSRRWQLVGPRVVVLHTGPLAARQRWWVAVLHAGPRATLCGISAALAEGLEQEEP